MNLDSSTIDRIVAGVLKQLAGGGDGAPSGVTAGRKRCTRPWKLVKVPSASA